MVKLYYGHEAANPHNFPDDALYCALQQASDKLQQIIGAEPSRDPASAPAQTRRKLRAMDLLKAIDRYLAAADTTA